MTELSVDRVTDLTSSALTDTFVLDSDLAAMAGLEDWVDQVAIRHAMSDKTRFAAKLCIEESVSNSIRHGYKGVLGSQVRVEVSGSAEAGWEIKIEDDAPHFNPLNQPELPAISPDYTGLGGQGIRLMRAFSSSIGYQPLEPGNRLRIALAPTGSQSDTSANA